MHEDFASFVGAWALLLSCVVLVIEPLAHGARWFNRALRLSTGLAGLVTFLLARASWGDLQQVKGMVPPDVLKQHPELWDQAAFESLTMVFLALWVVAVAVTVPAMAPSSFYRRITGLLAGAPFAVTFVAIGTWASIGLPGFTQLPGSASVVFCAAMMGSIIFLGRWGLQRKTDQWLAQLKLHSQSLGRTRVATWLKSMLVREDAPLPDLSPADAAVTAEPVGRGAHCGQGVLHG